MRLIISGLLLVMLCSLSFAITTIAVTDFEDLSGTNLGKQAAECFRTALINSGSYAVVERDTLQRIAEEQKFSISELADPSKAARFGKLLGAEYLAMGSISAQNEKWVMNVRFIDVNTAQAVKAAQVTGDSKIGCVVMAQQMADKITRQDKKYVSGDVVFSDSFSPYISGEWQIWHQGVEIQSEGGRAVLGHPVADQNAGCSLTLPEGILPADYQITIEFTLQPLPTITDDAPGTVVDVFTTDGPGAVIINLSPEISIVAKKEVHPYMVVNGDYMTDDRLWVLNGAKRIYDKGLYKALRKGVKNTMLVEKNGSKMSVSLNGIKLASTTISGTGELSIGVQGRAVLNLYKVVVTML